ncbi:MAG: DNA mismatch repair protein MutS [Saprospiraceae bacterium]|jgi:DNA mismatch repair protein MutS|nr:DNA mismatch repair protein MutS [Saprospiraceae bacterium]MBP6448267.1 DNA mismatch repair protein MutS [Saprospiraceae bacterium]
MSKVTPLMSQYFKLKAKHPDAILLYRVGDFYETFAEDAIKVSEILGIVLTKRNNGGNDIELAGFPYHSLDTYLPKLVRAGHRVAICEQLEKPSKEKKIVDRGVTDVVTPGVTTDDTILDRKSNNFLASIYFTTKNEFGVAFLDISTGEFLVSEGNAATIEKLIDGFNPSEIIFSKAFLKDYTKTFGERYYYYGIEEWVYMPDYTRTKLLNKFDVTNLKGFGIEELPLAQVAAGAVIHYLNATQNEKTSHISGITRIQSEHFVWLDRFTIKNLELLKSAHESGSSLAHVMDKTVTPMGARLLRNWILLPLLSVDRIQARLDMVSYFYEKYFDRDALTDLLRQTGDIARIASKLAMEKISPRELLQLKKSLDLLPDILAILKNSENEHLILLADKLNLCAKLKEDIGKTISDDPPALVSKGNVIRQGHHDELDDLRNVIRNSKELLLEIQVTEAERTGIASLKIGFNNVFGYYLEVTNKYKDHEKIPASWVRKQTLANAERYISEDLKKLETKILTAEEKISDLEEKLYHDLVLKATEYIDALQQNAKNIAILDCILSFATIAEKYGYTRPEVDESYEIVLKDARHPVIERQLPLGHDYVPNDIHLDSTDTQIMMITGPNMSGKSAVLRQTALIVLMAQMGSYVPASSAKTGIVDKIFTRVGASDNISSGESTFMLEMNETASIMNNISARSLILLDEIGRGTSTYDGISIAWSLAEFLHNGKVTPKTLFATHYHELNELAEKYPRIKNYNVTTKEIGNKVIFLRKLVEGGCEHSFGIHVAAMAGMPREIISRAMEILQDLEQKRIENPATDSNLRTNAKNIMPNNFQLSLFETVDPAVGQMKELIKSLDLNTMTPIECMLKLHELKKLNES